MRVQGFCFSLLQYSHIQAFTARFVPSIQLYHQRRKTAHRALQWRFMRLFLLSRQRYQNDTIGYNTACATLERLHTSRHAQPIPNITDTYGRCTGQHSRHIIIRYISVRRCAPVMDPCQTAQQIASHASPAGQLLPCVDCWQVMTRCQQYRPGAPAEMSASSPVQG